MEDLENKEELEETEEYIDWDETQKQGRIVKKTRKKEKKEVVDYKFDLGRDDKDYRSSRTRPSVIEDKTPEKYAYEAFKESLFSKIMYGLLFLAFLGNAALMIYLEFAKGGATDNKNLVFMALHGVCIALFFSLAPTAAIETGIWPRRKDNKEKVIKDIIVAAVLFIFVVTFAFAFDFVYEGKVRNIILIISGAYVLFSVLLGVIARIISKRIDKRKND